MSFQVGSKHDLVVLVVFSDEGCFAWTHKDHFYFALNEQQVCPVLVIPTDPREDPVSDAADGVFFSDGLITLLKQMSLLPKIPVIDILASLFEKDNWFAFRIEVDSWVCIRLN